MPAGAQSDEERGGSFTITDENDAWSNPFGPHQDRHYTHGVKLTYAFGKFRHFVDEVAQFFEDSNSAKRFSALPLPAA